MNGFRLMSKKKLFPYVLALLAIVFACVPAPALAATKAVAQIGDTTYTKLQSALDAVQDGQTITLLDDVDECTVASKSTFTLDLNGKVLSNSGTKKHTLEISGTANVTIVTSQDAGEIGWEWSGGALESEADSVHVSSADASCTIEAGVTVTNEEWAALCITDGALTVNGGTFTGENLFALYVKGGTVVVNDGTFTCEDDWSAARAGDKNLKTATELTINGGTFNALDDVALEVWGVSVVTINDGTFTTSGDVNDVIDMSDSASLTVNDGTIGSPDGEAGYSISAYYKDTCTLAINGGTIYGTVDFEGSNTFTGVSGGTFGANFGVDVVNNLAEGKAMLCETEGMFKVVDLADAKAAASKLVNYSFNNLDRTPHTIYFKDAEAAQKFYESHAEDRVKPTIQDVYHATFASRGKTVETRGVVAGDKLGELPDAEAVYGNEFVGWYVNGEYADENKAGSDTVVTSDLSLVALWLPNGSTTPTDQPVEKFCASIGDVKYHTLQNAIDAAQASQEANQTITLLDDITESATASKGAFTIDLAGKTLTAGDGAALTVAGAANVTLTNSEDAGGIESGDTDGVHLTGDSTTLVVEDGVTITSEGSSALRVDSGALTVNGGTFKTDGDNVLLIAGGDIAVNAGDFHGLISYESPETDDADLTISGGTYDFSCLLVVTAAKQDVKDVLVNTQKRCEVLDADVAKVRATCAVRFTVGGRELLAYFESADDAKAFCKQLDSAGFSNQTLKIFKVTFESLGETIKTDYLLEGEKLGELPAVESPIADFVGWYVDGVYSEANKVDASTVPTSDLLIKSMWIKRSSPAPDDDSGSGSGSQPTSDPTSDPAGKGTSDSGSSTSNEALPETGDVTVDRIAAVALSAAIAIAICLWGKKRTRSDVFEN